MPHSLVENAITISCSKIKIFNLCLEGVINLYVFFLIFLVYLTFDMCNNLSFFVLAVDILLSQGFMNMHFVYQR